MNKFKIKIGEGECVHKFYLPVYRLDYSRITVCYPFWLAPFVLLWRILRHCSESVWGDLLSFNEALENLKRLKK